MAKVSRESEVVDPIPAGEERFLTFKEEVELSWRIAQGDLKARERLILANLRLVDSIASRFMGRGMEKEDLFQEGCIGLMRGVKKYDPEKGCRVSTYTTYHIRQKVNRAIQDQAQTIRHPVHIAESVGQINNAFQFLTQLLGGEPTTLEIAEFLGENPEKVSFIMNIAQANHLLSLEQPVRTKGGDDGLPLEETVTKRGDLSTEELAEQGIARELMKKELAKLNDLQAKILELRFGLTSEKPLTLDETAAKLGYSREWVRLAEKEALEKLRESDDLRSWYDS